MRSVNEIRAELSDSASLTRGDPLRAARTVSGNSARSSAWRVAAQPAFALLGVALPIDFLMTLESMLHYLRPKELLPTLGTAWLFLAALMLPVVAAIAISLVATGASRRLRVLHWAISSAVTVGTAATIVAALISGVLAWLRAGGWLVDVHLANEMILLSLLLGALAAVPRTGRELIAKVVACAAAMTAIGALSVLAIPLSRWPSDGGRGMHATPPAGAALHGRPHILLLTMDALSADHMSLYGYRRQTTPMLAAFAEHATVFESAFANANLTTAGVASILTGTRPWTHRALQLPSWPLESARRDSLPVLLRREGYQTASVATNPYAAVRRQGFGQYFDFTASDRVRGWWGLCSDRLSSITRYACAAAQIPVVLAMQEEVIPMLSEDPHNLFRDPSVATDTALEWLRTVNKSRPVFLWVHLFVPHSPYATPPPWIGTFDSSADARLAANSGASWGFRLGKVPPQRVRTLEARYDESVLYVDHYAGEFLSRALRILGDNTVVVISADHGESFSHGYGGHTGPGLDDEIIRIPLIIKMPRQTQALRIRSIAEQIDIAPTLAAVAGAAIPRSFEGRSLLKAWSTPDALPPPNGGGAFSMNFEQSDRFGRLTHGSVAVIDRNWKLVHYIGTLHYPLMSALHDELYDLATDRGESKNLATSEPDQTMRLRTLIDAQLAVHARAIP